jgi:BirA family biotin operon repressor/biotin-[acetyl-CoA-carboxylase] ligase
VGSSGQRAPLDAVRLAGLLAADPRWPWGPPEVVHSIDSTNAELLRRTEVPVGSVLLAEEQTAGRGRLDRRWDSPAGAGVWMSVVVRPDVADWSWLPLLSGVAAAAGVRACGPHLDVGLKWPNDVLIGDAKVGGILVERRGPDAVVGIGIDVHQGADELRAYAAAGGTTAVSLDVAGSSVERVALAAEVLGALAERLAAWQAAGGDAGASGLREEYLRLCRTIGWVVRVSQASGDLVGDAVDIDDGGRLIVSVDAGPVRVSAGDVTRVRPERGPKVQG